MLSYRVWYAGTLQAVGMFGTGVVQMEGLQDM